MQVGRRQACNNSRNPALRGNGENRGLTRVVSAVMANAEDRTIKRKRMIIVVTIGKVRIYQDTFFFLQIESVQMTSIVRAPAAVKNQGLAIAHPVRRFKRLARLMDHFQLSTVHFKNFQNAPEIIAVRSEALLNRTYHPRVVE